MGWNPNSVSNANEASLFINAAAWVAEAGSETWGEIERIRTYYTEFYQQFGADFITKLKDRIKDGSFSPNTASKIDPNVNWGELWGPKGPLVAQVDEPQEAGFLMNALCWIAEESGFAPEEYNRIRSYFDEYNGKFGSYFIDDLRSRIAKGDLAANTMENVAPGWNW